MLPTLTLKLPTAVQAEAAVHETPDSSFDWVSLVFGLGTIDQVTPFHCSTRVLLSSLTWWGGLTTPTAMQCMVERHEVP